MFRDFGELLTLNAMWLKGFLLADMANDTVCEQGDVIGKVASLLLRYDAMKERGFESGAQAEVWMRDLSTVVRFLWD